MVPVLLAPPPCAYAVLLAATSTASTATPIMGSFMVDPPSHARSTQPIALSTTRHAHPRARHNNARTLSRGRGDHNPAEPDGEIPDSRDWPIGRSEIKVFL